MRSSIRQIFSLFITLFTMLQFPCLEAGGWGNTEKVTEYEGTQWNGVYFNLNGLHFDASIPNYSGAVLQNDTASLSGEVGEAGYVIITSFNPGFTPPKSIKKFLKMIQEANPDYTITAIDCKKGGAKYAVDMVPMNQEVTAYWRFFSTKDRLIKMGTADTNENRRLHFFGSMRIH